jgi:hypothetical protein
MSKQTAIQKKQPAQLEKKNLKKKLVLLVLRERQQNKVTTNKVCYSTFTLTRHLLLICIFINK